MFLYLTLSLLGTRGEPGHLGRQLKGPAVNNDRRAAGSEGGQLGANKAFECVTNAAGGKSIVLHMYILF